MLVGLTTVLPKYTLLLELKFVPYIVTEVPIGPEVGEREEIMGRETVAVEVTVIGAEIVKYESL